MFDYCLMVKNEVDLLKKHLESLFKHENVNFPIHIIIIGDEYKDEICDVLMNFGEFVIHIIPNYPKETFEKGIWQLGSPAAYESSYAYDWTMNNCGDNEWKILVHPDTSYIGPFLDQIRPKFEIDKMGVIGGIGLGFLAVRKAAYDSCDIGFVSLMGVQAFPCPGDPRTLCLRRGTDPRPVDPGNPRNVLGLDVGELFLMDLLGRNWIYEIQHSTIAALLYHRGNGSNY